MTTAERIYQLVKTMPNHEADMVLKFVEFLQQRTVHPTSNCTKTLLDYFGALSDSPTFNDDPVVIQRKLRHEWD